MSRVNIHMSGNTAGGDIMAVRGIKLTSDNNLYEKIARKKPLKIHDFLIWMTCTDSASYRIETKGVETICWFLTDDKHQFLMDIQPFDVILDFLEENGFPPGGFVYMRSGAPKLFWRSNATGQDYQEFEYSSLPKVF